MENESILLAVIVVIILAVVYLFYKKEYFTVSGNKIITGVGSPPHESMGLGKVLPAGNLFGPQQQGDPGVLYAFNDVNYKTPANAYWNYDQWGAVFSLGSNGSIYANNLKEAITIGLCYYQNGQPQAYEIFNLPSTFAIPNVREFADALFPNAHSDWVLQIDINVVN